MQNPITPDTSSRKYKIKQLIISFFAGNILIIGVTLFFFYVASMGPGAGDIFILFIPVIAVMVIIEIVYIIRLFIKNNKTKSASYIKPFVALIGLVLPFFLIFSFIVGNSLYYNYIKNYTSLDSQYSRYPIEKITPGIFNTQNYGAEAIRSKNPIFDEGIAIKNLVYPYETSSREDSKKPNYVKTTWYSINKKTNITIIGAGDPLKDKYFEIISGEYFNVKRDESGSIYNNVIRQMSIKKTDIKIINDKINNYYKEEALKGAESVTILAGPKYLNNTHKVLKNGQIVDEEPSQNGQNGFYIQTEKTNKLDIDIPRWADINFDRKTIDKDKKYKIKEAQVYYYKGSDKYFVTKLYLE